MKHIASCSFGKDSMATVLLAIEHGEPLDEAVYCEVMFSDTISGEAPEHRDFIYNKAIPYLKSHGIKTTVLKSYNTFIDLFYKKIQKGKHAGKIRSWPLCGKCMIQRDCKKPPINQFKRSLTGQEVVQYIGYAKDEQERLLKLSDDKISLLQKYEYTEGMAKGLCKKHGLLSPIYEFTERNGCFFCPNARETELRHLYDYHPELWEQLLACQKAPNKCTERFNRTMRFDEIDYNFRMDDEQISFFEAIGIKGMAEHD